MAQQNLRQLLHEQGRHVDAVTLKERNVCRLEIGRGNQSIPKTQPDAVIVPRIGVGDGCDLGVTDSPSRVDLQAAVQRSFAIVGLG